MGLRARKDPSEAAWLTLSGIDEAYGQLVWQGFACGADDASDKLNERWVAEMERRLAADGLRGRFRVVADGLADHYRPEFVMCRLELPDGTLPPDPNYWKPGNRARVRAQVEAHWGQILELARSRFPVQPPLEDASEGGWPISDDPVEADHRNEDDELWGVPADDSRIRPPTFEEALDAFEVDEIWAYGIVSFLEEARCRGLLVPFGRDETGELWLVLREIEPGVPDACLLYLAPQEARPRIHTRFGVSIELGTDNERPRDLVQERYPLQWPPPRRDLVTDDELQEDLRLLEAAGEVGRFRQRGEAGRLRVQRGDARKYSRSERARIADWERRLRALALAQGLTIEARWVACSPRVDARVLGSRERSDSSFEIGSMALVRSLYAGRG